MTDIPDNLQNSHGTGSGTQRASKFWMVQVVAVGGVFVVLSLGLWSAFRNARERALRTQCPNNLKQIGLALHAYHEQYKVLPPAYTVDANGNPLHSWRTLILPFLDQAELYKSIDLAKPWNDPANARAFASVVANYQCLLSGTPPSETTYLAIVTPQSGIRVTECRNFAEITDGLSHTLLVIEVPASRAVHWMSPLDADESLVLSIDSKMKPTHTTGSHGLMGDGSIRTIPPTMPVAQRLALISIAGNEPIDEF